jgi:hypothetical protein
MLNVWDAKTGKPEQTLCGHTDDVFAVAFEQHGRWLASVGEDTMLVASWPSTSARFHLELSTASAFLRADLGHDRGDTLDRAKRRKRVDADRRRSLSIEIIGGRDTDRDHCARPIPAPFTDGADRRGSSSHRRPGSPSARRRRPARQWQRSGIRTPIS